MVRSWFPALVAFMLVPSLGATCSPSVPEMEQLARRDRLIEEQYLRELIRDADNVVVGTVLEVSDSNDVVYAQEARIEVERVLKGPVVPFVTALMYKRNTQKEADVDGDPLAMDEIVSCGDPYNPTREDPYIIQTARGLFYIQAGVLKRVNSFPVEPQLLLYNTEAELRFVGKEID